MFKKNFFTLFVIIACLGGWLCFSILWLGKEDRLKYQKLTESANEPKQSQLTYSQQQRYGICKEVWYQQEKQKLQFRILSNHSTLFLFHEKNQLEVVEQMNDVKCIMQEELYYLLPDGREAIEGEKGLVIKKTHSDEPSIAIAKDFPGIIPMQIVRYLEAEKACYNYNTQLFIADAVHLFRYRLKGHDLVPSVKGIEPFMTGNAKSVEFAFKGSQCNFVAHQFKAVFDTVAGGI